MQESQRARQPEPERTRDVSAPKPTQRKEQVQHSNEPPCFSLYEQIVGNRVPPHLRLSASPQTSDEQPAPCLGEKESEQEVVPQGELLAAPVSGEASSPLQRREALRAHLLRNQGVSPYLRLSSTSAAGHVQPVQRQFESEERVQEPSVQEPSHVGRKEALRVQLWGTGVPHHLRLSPLSEPVQHKENRTGLPDRLKEGVENLSGLSLDDVQVHYHSSKPAQVQALAYTQGTEIHVGSGQEQHLAHEAWHVVQQKQGRASPTWQAKGMAINDDQQLESEADVMGRRANSMQCYVVQDAKQEQSQAAQSNPPIVQRVRGKRVTATQIPWLWGEDLTGQWQRHNIPIHPCHTTHIGRDQLVGGYTLIDENGVPVVSRVYGAFEPKEGAKAVGHMEPQLFNAMENDLLGAMADDKLLGDNVLALVEIHQWNTPCGGEKGCALFLEQKIEDLGSKYNEVSVSGRFSAEGLYSSSLTKAHYLNPYIPKGSISDENTPGSYTFTGQDILHLDTQTHH